MLLKIIMKVALLSVVLLAGKCIQTCPEQHTRIQLRKNKRKPAGSTLLIGKKKPL